MNRKNIGEQDLILIGFEKGPGLRKPYGRIKIIRTYQNDIVYKCEQKGKPVQFSSDAIQKHNAYPLIFKSNGHQKTPTIFINICSRK